MLYFLHESMGLIRCHVCGHFVPTDFDHAKYRSKKRFYNILKIARSSIS